MWEAVRENGVGHLSRGAGHNRPLTVCVSNSKVMELLSSHDEQLKWSNPSQQALLPSL